MIQRQVVSIPFTKGIDTKTDEKLVEIGTLTAAENCIFTKQGQVKKRNGYDKLTTNIDGGGQYENPKGLAAYNDELLAFANDHIYSYSENNAEWIDKGFVQNVTVNVENYGGLISNTSSQSIARSNNIAVMVYSGASALPVINTGSPTYSIFISIKDELTGSFYVQNYNAGTITVATYPADVRVESADGRFYVFYCIDGTTYMRVISEANPATIGAPYTVNNAFLRDLRVKKNGVDVYCSFTSTANQVRLYKFTGGVLNLSYVLIDGVISTSTIHITGLYCMIVYQNAAGVNLQLVTMSTMLASGVPVAVYVAVLSRNNLSVVNKGSNFYLFSSVVASRLVYVGEFNLSGSVVAEAILSRGALLYSEAFVVDDNAYYATSSVSWLPGDQTSVYVHNISGNIIATLCRDSFGSKAIAAEASITDIKVYGSKAFFPLSKDIIADSPLYYTLTEVSLNSYEIDFNPDQNINARALGNVLYTTGGYLGMYDGKGFCENGFFEQPVIYTSTPSTAANSSINTTSITDSFVYSVVYEWIDNVGNLHQSAPHLTTIIPGGINNYNYVFSIPRLQYTTTYKKNNVTIALYRTLKNQITPYLVFRAKNDISGGAFAALAVNTAEARGINDDFVEIRDNLSDATLANNQVLYTAGGVLENFVPPCPSVLEIYKNRLAVMSPDSSNDMIWFSKNFAYGYGVGFNEALTTLVNPIGGAITALKFMDDKLLIFKENILYALNGDGPNDLGLGGSFGTPELISSDVGCITQNSLVLMPNGVMFKSHKGIYLCSRQLQIEYIGAGVEAYNSLTIMSADLMQDKNQVRFLTRDGSLLLYDYYFQNWATFTNHQGIDATMWRGVYTYMRTDDAGTIYTEGSSGLDDITTFKMKVRTAWIKLAGIQGFQRIRRFGFLGGELAANHVLNVKIRYDYQNYDSDIIIFDVGPLLGTMYGSGYYGEMSVYGGEEDGVYQFRGHMPRQKCESVQFTFEDISGEEALNTYSISDLALEVGVKQGINKMKVGRTVG